MTFIFVTGHRRNDVMWLRNSFARLSKNKSEDLQISTDLFLGDPRPEKQLINSGFYYVRSKNKTIKLSNTWRSSLATCKGSSCVSRTTQICRLCVSRCLALARLIHSGKSFT